MSEEKKERKRPVKASEKQDEKPVEEKDVKVEPDNVVEEENDINFGVDEGSDDELGADETSFNDIPEDNEDELEFDHEAYREYCDGCDDDCDYGDYEIVDDEDTVEPKLKKDISEKTLMKIALGTLIVVDVMCIIILLFALCKKQTYQVSLNIDIDKEAFASLLNNAGANSVEKYFYISENSGSTIEGMAESKDSTYQIGETDADNYAKEQNGLIYHEEENLIDNYNEEPNETVFEESYCEPVYEQQYLEEEKPYIGIECATVSDEYLAYGFPKGVFVLDVQEGEAAEFAGIEEGDIITAVNGAPVESTEDISRYIAGTKVNDVVTVSVTRIRNNKVFTRDIKVIIGNLNS